MSSHTSGNTDMYFGNRTKSYDLGDVTDPDAQGQEAATKAALKKCSLMWFIMLV